MAIKSITLPDIGNYDNTPVIEVLVSPGDRVEKEDSLITLESDKATMEIPSPYTGEIKKVLVKVDDTLNQGDLIAEIEADDEAEAPAAEEKPAEEPASEAPAEQKPAEPETPAPAAEKAPEPAAPAAAPVNRQSAGAKSHASPSVRLFARKLGVDLANVTGTGPKGRIRQEDVEGAIKKVMEGVAKGGAATGAGIPPLPEIDFSQFGEIEERPLSRIKKLSGKHLSTAWLNIPHVTQFDETDITELEAFRKSLKPRAEKAGIKMTPLVFVLKALAHVLREFPNMNASLAPDGEHLIVKKYINLGVAVDTPNGLVVPVVRDVDQKGIFELSEELMEISARARDGKLTGADLSGGTFSVSSLGGIGGTQFTPIVNGPEVGILGVSKASMQPVWNGSEFEPRLMLPLALSYDHRVIDGAEGARFMTTLSRTLTDLRELML
ncbi:dihydrolipoyllysine-residue acetyltransferase [Guyparkeria hydrothermalis]|uniref:dihydrolipoyllysine-residue acetyltransferase n=1 Tax=Guyparkeria TaxID=2035712 RepID=UPI0010AC253D|nr:MULTISPECIES: dihydrolipoyllysine-residue acetyltransferase [Guyparkeria]MCL7751709.1 dihydrolipoyllysine-residue acetyltransferase [Guyparkeria hydrothermalis]TKA91212.1 dihydrolipoyllysine-residue acetyltransferase [Guyparkeria sp. SB14A]